jgi:hypothetical protein
LDSYSYLYATDSGFTYSSVQYYVPQNYASNAPNPHGQSPCNPSLGGSTYTYASVTKISTSPIPLNSPSNTENTSTGDTYSATVTYDGNNLIINLYDITAGGTCTPVTSGTCFANTWSGVNIPSAVGSNTAWVGLGSGTSGAAPAALLVNTFSYKTP